jgi:hypothetical protein
LRRIWLGVLAVFYATTLVQAEPQGETFVDRPSGVQRRLLDGEFDALDEMAAQYIKTRARYPGGAWAIADFYDIITRYDSTGPCAENWGVSFDEKRLAMEKWMAAKPQSQTARIALASLWSRYAFTERGCGFSGETSRTQFEAFHDDLARAQELLQSVDLDSDPEAYRTAMRTAMIDDDPRARQAWLYDRAALAFPSLPDTVVARYFYLFPRWFGAPGEAGAFAKSLLSTPGGELGLELYFDVTASALTLEPDYSKLLSASGIDYSVLAKAFLARSKAFGSLKADMNVMLYYALAARDLQTADLLVSKIGDDWERSYWRDQETYDGVKLWIRQWSIISKLSPK